MEPVSVCPYCTKDRDALRAQLDAASQELAKSKELARSWNENRQSQIVRLGTERNEARQALAEAKDQHANQLSHLMAKIADERKPELAELASLRQSLVASTERERLLREALKDTYDALTSLQAACALSGMSPRIFAGHGGKAKAVLAPPAGDGTPSEPRNWMIHFEDRAVGPEIFTDETAARARLEACLQNWTCQLFVSVL